jgi:hypothetical protein
MLEPLRRALHAPRWHNSQLAAKIRKLNSLRRKGKGADLVVRQDAAPARPVVDRRHRRL